MYLWAVNKIFDRSGNYINFDYDYSQNDGTFKISHITYGHNSNVASGTYTTSVDFYYISRPDPSKTWVAGSVVQDLSILDRIEVTKSGNVLTKYQFTYEHKPIGATTNFYTHLPSAAGAEWTELRANRHARNWFKQYDVDWKDYESYWKTKR